MKKLFLLLFLSSIFWCCSDKEGPVRQVERAGYYWQRGDYTASVDDPIQRYAIRKLYIKYFEVNYSDVKGNFPFAKIYLDGTSFKLNKFQKVIPTIFIKNNVFKYSSEKQLDKLADNIIFLTNKYNQEKFKAIEEFEEIQIDCDWTESTQKKYFYFLSKIKKLSKKTISCTLRLYPFAYPEKMGIPPVDKAMLMCYNLIKPLSEKDKNSILDNTELEKYLKISKKYPIHLDVALPIFYWGHWYQNNQFNGLLSINSKVLEKCGNRLTERKATWYEITKDTTINYEYIRKGDLIKCEEVSTKTLHKTITLLKKHIPFDDKITVSLFDIQQEQFNQYTNEEISAFYNDFTK